MSDPTHGDSVGVSGLLDAATVEYHQLISHVLIGMLDMLCCDGIEKFVAFRNTMLVRGTVEMSNEEYTVRGVYI